MVIYRPLGPETLRLLLPSRVSHQNGQTHDLIQTTLRAVCKTAALFRNLQVVLNSVMCCWCLSVPNAEDEPPLRVFAQKFQTGLPFQNRPPARLQTLWRLIRPSPHLCKCGVHGVKTTRSTFPKIKSPANVVHMSSCVNDSPYPPQTAHDRAPLLILSHSRFHADTTTN
jgi:hypothetical protein